jgi:hypothetical protein
MHNSYYIGKPSQSPSMNRTSSDSRSSASSPSQSLSPAGAVAATSGTYVSMSSMHVGSRYLEDRDAYDQFPRQILESEESYWEALDVGKKELALLAQAHFQEEVDRRSAVGSGSGSGSSGKTDMDVAIALVKAGHRKDLNEALVEVQDKGGAHEALVISAANNGAALLAEEARSHALEKSLAKTIDELVNTKRERDAFKHAAVALAQERETSDYYRQRCNDLEEKNKAYSRMRFGEDSIVGIEARATTAIVHKPRTWRAPEKEARAKNLRNNFS